MSMSKLYGIVAGAALVVLGATPLQGQAPDSAAVSYDSAQALRAALRRPPAKPPFDAVDAVALPVRVVTFPLQLVASGLTELVGLSSDPELPFGEVLAALDEVGVSPFVGSIGPRSGIAGGLSFRKPRPLYAQTALSIRGSQLYRAGLLLARGGDRIEAGYTFQRNTQIHFWGVGPGSDEDDVADYLLDVSEFAANGSLRIAPFTIGAGAAFEDNRVGRGKDDAVPDLHDVVTEDTLFGLRQRTNYLRFDLRGELDLTRVVAGLQRRGLRLHGSTSLFRGVDGTDSDFHRISGGLVGYLPLNLRQSLAVQLLAEVNRGDDGPGVPFTHLATLGDHRGARAYPSDRFRERDMAALMAEWRYEIWRELHGRGRAEGFVFFDDGGVEHDLFDLSAADLRESYGFGLRGVWGGRLLALAYLAFGDEGARLQATFSWAY